MKISFIGTGTMGSITRGNQSLLIDDILFDVGSGTVKRMESQKIYTKDIKYLVKSCSTILSDAINSVVCASLTKAQFLETKTPF